METNYTVDYFIKMYEQTNEDEWCILNFNIGNKFCAYGYCDIKNPGNGVFCEKGKLLQRLFESIKITRKATASFINPVMVVNDGDALEYQQPTPKQRILAALYDIKKLQEPKHIDITKELAVLPIQETSDVIATKETILS